MADEGFRTQLYKFREKPRLSWKGKRKGKDFSKSEAQLDLRKEGNYQRWIIQIQKKIFYRREIQQEGRSGNNLM